MIVVLITHECDNVQDSKGRLIGINTAIADPSGRGSNSGVGFAIPFDQVKGLVEQILTYGRIIRPVLGISIAPPQVPHSSSRHSACRHFLARSRSRIIRTAQACLPRIAGYQACCW